MIHFRVKLFWSINELYDNIAESSFDVSQDKHSINSHNKNWARQIFLYNQAITSAHNNDFYFARKFCTLNILESKLQDLWILRYKTVT